MLLGPGANWFPKTVEEVGSVVHQLVKKKRLTEIWIVTTLQKSESRAAPDLPKQTVAFLEYIEINELETNFTVQFS